MPSATDLTDVRLGTRSSALAMWQANWVADQLVEFGVRVQILQITTTGDQRSEPITQSGEQGVFTKEIQRALLDDRIDVAVHSLKDLPTDPVDGIRLSAVPARESPGDVLVTESSATVATLPAESRVGTGSVRRKSQLLAARPDLEVRGIRGNVDTRLRKLQQGEYDALVLAEAGLRRLGLEQHITQVIPCEVMLPAVGQGALGIETRSDDQKTQAVLSVLDDAATHQAVLAERTLLATLCGGCLAPVGAWARMEGDDLKLDAVVLSSDGQQRVSTQVSGRDAIELGRRAAENLLLQGARQLIDSARES